MNLNLKNSCLYTYVYLYTYISIISYPIEHETVGFGAARNRHSPTASSTRSGGEYFGASHHFVEKHTPQYIIPKIHDILMKFISDCPCFPSVHFHSHPFSADRQSCGATGFHRCFTVLHSLPLKVVKLTW